MALGGALAIFDKQGFPLFFEEGLLSSLRVSDQVETIRLPLKGFQVKQLIFLWLERHEMIALCSLCWACGILFLLASLIQPASPLFPVHWMPQAMPEKKAVSLVFIPLLIEPYPE